MKKQTYTVGSLKKSKDYIPKQKKPLEQFELSKKKEKVAPLLVFSQNTKTWTVLAKRFRTVLDTALEQKKEIDFKCKKGSCGRCMVHVESGGQLLSEITEMEIKKLGDKSKAGARLACQARFLGRE